MSTSKSGDRTIGQVMEEALRHHQAGRVQQAESLYREVLLAAPHHPDALHLLGAVALQQGRNAEAVELISRAIQANPNSPRMYNNLGLACYAQGNLMGAAENYRKALELNPSHAEAYFNLGNTFRALKRFPEALEYYASAVALKPDHPFLYGLLLGARRAICDWSDAQSLCSALEEKVARGDKVILPFDFLAISDNPYLQRKAAEIWVRHKYPEACLPSAAPGGLRERKIRIGYFSSDLYNHAVSVLMAELFELHDKSRFEIVAFSFGRGNNDAMTERISKAFDRFFDVGGLSDQQVASMSREMGIDIAVDLNGFTQGNRARIFALRAAPIQVNYLGYPGTMGASFMDYLIADEVLIPEQDRQFYAEKIAYLPNSYQVNDTQRRISERRFERAGFGLPPMGFVFCCFNNNYKITPATFESWMRIMRRVEGSVLWLLEDNLWAKRNLLREAERNGVAGSRIVFAERMELSEHLARHRLADLFLDTFTYNAHTTCSDALWVGLPVLTCMGQSFAGRVAASLLRAVQLPELIARAPEEYESMAVALASEPERLRQIRDKLVRNCLTAPLFDTRSFTRHIESIYEAMCARHQAGLPPEHMPVRLA